jgi:hypothetical protein
MVNVLRFHGSTNEFVVYPDSDTGSSGCTMPEPNNAKNQRDVPFQAAGSYTYNALPINVAACTRQPRR